MLRALLVFLLKMSKRAKTAFPKILLVLLLGSAWAQGQEKYLEDQFYAGIAYNILTQRPDQVVQRSLSYHLEAGLIKDIPLNPSRTFGFGLGLGYSADAFYSNIGATQDGEGVAYTVLDNQSFKRSKIQTHGIDVPFEIRLRSSTPETYKFWRVHAGMKATYLFGARSVLVTDEQRSGFKNRDVRQWQVGAMLNFGYNTFNIHLYYGITPLLDPEAQVNGETISSRVIRAGVIFYIL